MPFHKSSILRVIFCLEACILAPILQFEINHSNRVIASKKKLHHKRSQKSTDPISIGHGTHSSAFDVRDLCLLIRHQYEVVRAPCELKFM